MSKSILQATLVGLLSVGAVSAQSTALVPVSMYGSPKADFGVKVFPVGDLVNPPKGSPLAEPGDDEAMKAAAKAYINVRVEALKKEILGSMSDFVWTANRCSAGLEYFPNGQSLLVINTPAGMAHVGECLDTMRMVRNTFVQVDVHLFKVPCETESVKKLFGDKQTTAITSEELTTLLDGLKKSGQINIITAPRITVANRQTGGFEALQKLPNDNRSVGVSCRMTPDLSSDMKSIRLKLDVTNSAPSPTNIQLGNGLMAVAVNSQQTATSVEMKNEGTFGVKLGIHKAEQRVENKIPVLGDLPYLDGLFRNTSIKVERMETIAVFTASQVKPTNPSVYPPLPAPTPHLLPHPSLQTVQAVLPKPMSVPCPEPTLADYHAACAAGKKDEAMLLAVQLLKKDPMCFGQRK